MCLKRCFRFAALLLALALPLCSQTLPKGVQKVRSIEGIDEFVYSNGLDVLLIPDSSKPKVTVNVVYKVGSRNEGYGETGMAHLLEHMLFKSSTSGREIFKELTNKSAGAFNGTTSYDQTMYYESFPASVETLKWALELETDRMVNMTMKGQDLVTEMPVVRNEMEAGENEPGEVLEKRVLAAAFNFHSYGKSVIGNRSDVERVPIANLAAFYHKYYQPDNAVLIVAGNFDESKALELAATTLGALPKPTRVLSQPYTEEPTQEGERFVKLERIGDQQLIQIVYHIPAALSPEMAPIEVLAQVVGAPQTGRLYKELVDQKKAVQGEAYAEAMHDPGIFSAEIEQKPEQNIEDARLTALKVLENFKQNPPTTEEVDRAKTRLAKNFELTLADSQRLAMMLGSYIGSGDWRNILLLRDEIARVTPAEVERVAEKYLQPSNRTLGEFVPTKAPQRAQIPATPKPDERFKGFTGAAAQQQQGESFDATPKNIEARTKRVKLANGMTLILFPKKTRGGVVSATVNLRFGDEKSLFGKSTAADLAGSLLMRGTEKLNRQQIQDAADKLKAQISVSGSASGAKASVKTVEANLGESLKLVQQILRTPAFPEAEFAQVKQQELAEVESGKSDPQMLTSVALNRRLNPQYARGDVRYVATLDEQIEDLNKVTLDEVRSFYKQFYGPGQGEITVSGQFDPAQIEALAKELFADWKSPAHYERVADTYTKLAASNDKIETPDKQNSLFLTANAFSANDESSDYPALILANAIFGGSTNSRLFTRIRVRDGLSYGAGSELSIPTKDDSAALLSYAISAPQNTPKVETDFLDELQKAVTTGFTQDELDKAKKTWLDQQAISRADEASIGRQLQRLERWGRTFDWQAQLEAKVSAVTLDQINAAFRKYVDPKTLVIVKGGDFKKAGAYQQ
jgi:zinc protease